MTITAATRKGSGRTNQDRYIIGPNFAAVFDGASSFSEEPPEHDGGWYAETLAASLQDLLTGQPDDPLPNIVERAIESVVTEHDLRPDTSPTSTIALARWNDEEIEVYVLGDSTVAIIHPDGSEDAYSDDRLASIGGELRRAYRERLAAGSGFDDQHRQLLVSLQGEQAKWRNRGDGYWIAGAAPEAAAKAVLRRVPLTNVEQIILASDGAASGVVRYGTFESWRSMANTEAARALAAVEENEEADSTGETWPRAKPSDDKAYVRVVLTAGKDL